MPTWDDLTDFCPIRPSYHHMEQGYNDYIIDSAPCKAGVRNQCAVRMSVALERCGFSLGAFDPPNRVHRGRSRCHLDRPHVLGAQELARYLTRLLGEPEKFRGSAAHSANEDLAERHGIIYFNNCFKRKRTDETRKGDHIDLWTGSQYYNNIIHVGAGGDARSGARLFRRSNAVWFFELN